MNPFSVDKDGKDALWSSSTAGFSMIELLVTIAVMGVVAGMVFTQRASFSRSVNLKNVTQEIAVAVRQAQVYGTASRGSDLGDDIYGFSYGIFFSTDNMVVGDAPINQQFRMFRDSDNDDKYESSEDIEVYVLPRNMRIERICMNNFGDTGCTSGDESHLVAKFSRPHPDAEFFDLNGNEINEETAVIVIEEIDSGRDRKVIVQSSGFITTE